MGWHKSRKIKLSK